MNDDQRKLWRSAAAFEGIEAFPAEVRSQLFGVPLAVGPHADGQTRLLAVAGHRQ
jgi:hypothetical protein